MIGSHVVIEGWTEIGENCRIGIDPLPRTDGDFENYSIRDGVIVIHTDGILAPGSVI